MTAPEDIDIPIPHCLLKAQVWGRGKPTKVLALHGWLDNSASFAPVAPLLPDVEFVAVDLPGHGHSAHKPKGFVLHFIDTVADCLAIADGLGWQTFKLVGHSMGAGIATLVAGAVPDRIDDLVLIEGLGPISATPDKAVDGLQTHLRQLRRLAQKKYPVYKTVAEAVAARLASGDMSPSACRMIVERGLRDVAGGVTWRSDARLRVKSALSFSEEQIETFLKGIACPVLVIRARPGFGQEILHIEARKRLLKNLTYSEITGNHHAHMDQAAEVAELMRQFYGR